MGGVVHREQGVLDHGRECAGEQRGGGAARDAAAVGGQRGLEADPDGDRGGVGGVGGGTGGGTGGGPVEHDGRAVEHLLAGGVDREGPGGLAPARRVASNRMCHTTGEVICHGSDPDVAGERRVDARRGEGHGDLDQRRRGERVRLDRVHRQGQRRGGVRVGGALAGGVRVGGVLCGGVRVGGALCGGVRVGGVRAGRARQREIVDAPERLVGAVAGTVHAEQGVGQRAVSPGRPVPCGAPTVRLGLPAAVRPAGALVGPTGPVGVTSGGTGVRRHGATVTTVRPRRTADAAGADGGCGGGAREATGDGGCGGDTRGRCAGRAGVTTPSTTPHLPRPRDRAGHFPPRRSRPATRVETKVYFGGSAPGTFVVL